MRLSKRRHRKLRQEAAALAKRTAAHPNRRRRASAQQAHLQSSLVKCGARAWTAHLSPDGAASLRQLVTRALGSLLGTALREVHRGSVARKWAWGSGGNTPVSRVGGVGAGSWWAGSQTALCVAGESRDFLEDTTLSFFGPKCIQASPLAHLQAKPAKLGARAGLPGGAVCLAACPVAHPLAILCLQAAPRAHG